MCPLNSFGLDCLSACLCENSGECDHISGDCTCTAGYLEPYCNQSKMIILP